MKMSHLFLLAVFPYLSANAGLPKPPITEVFVPQVGAGQSINVVCSGVKANGVHIGVYIEMDAGLNIKGVTTSERDSTDVRDMSGEAIVAANFQFLDEASGDTKKMKKVEFLMTNPKATMDIRFNGNPSYARLRLSNAPGDRAMSGVNCEWFLYDASPELNPQ